jgi:DNA gyrase subunit A
MADSDLTEEEPRLRVMERLKILDALAVAIDRRDEVFDVIVTSPSADEAQSRIAALLGVTDSGAYAILDLQWRRLAELERSRIFEARDELRREHG